MIKLYQDTKSVFCGLFGKDSVEKVRVINGIPEDEIDEDKKKESQNNDSATPKITVEKERPEKPLEEIPNDLQLKNGRLPNIKKFWIHLSAGGKSKSTIKEYGYDYKWWTRKARNINTTPYSLKLGEMESFLSNMKPRTARRKISFLRSLGKWYSREGKSKLFIEVAKVDAPTLSKPLPGDLGAVEFEAIRDLLKILLQQGKREGLWIGLMIMCGLRVSEIKTAEVKDDIFIIVTGKGNKERLIPARLWLIQAMKSMPKEEVGGWKKDRSIIYKKVKKIGYKPHSLRHTYASELTRRGKNIEDIRVLLGHSDISTTTIYAQVNIPVDTAELLDS